MRKFLAVAGLLIAGALVGLALIVAVWYARPNRTQLAPALGAEVWPVVRNGLHNSNTHLTFWNDHFYLVHAESPFHMGTAESELVVRRSPDGREWTEAARLQVPGQDIRDPKFAIIGDELFLYALKNTSFEPEPYGTVLSTSSDGINWSSFEEVEPQGWLFWEPKTLDGKTWYATAYWHEHGKSALFRSGDGRRWEQVSQIHEGDRNDETALEFLPDGRMIVTARLEGDDRAWHQGSKNAATLLAVAEPPYMNWQKTISKVSRLDGPALFRHEGAVYAVGRYDPDGYDRWYGNSSLLGRKRTALYRVLPDRLILLSELPSAGDTSYPGVAPKDGNLYITYYTNDINRDFPWLLGLILPSDIQMARIPLSNLEELARDLSPQ